MALEIIEYAKHNLERGEKILYQTGVHWIFLIRPLALLIIGLVVMTFAGIPDFSAYKNDPTNAFYNNMWVIFWPIGVAITLEGAYKLIRGYLTVLTTEITVTSRRVIWKSGLIWRDTDNIDRARIEGCRLADQSWLGQWLNYGTVKVKGIGGNTMTLGFAREPKKLQAHVTRPLSRKAPQKPSHGA